MGFLQKIKGFFGYGILEIDVQPISTTIDRHHPSVEGKVKYSTYSATFDKCTEN